MTAAMDEVKLNWAQASVEDSRLTIPLDGKAPKEWKQRFENTIRLLGRGEWGEVKLKKDGVHVEEVTPGTEDKVRHYLESVVAQANAPEEAEQPEPDEDGESEPEGPDAEMTERFRSFAEQDPDGSESEQED
jgi:hypothetical protein